MRSCDDGAPAELLVALHAEKCGAALLAAKARLPAAGAVLAFGGTELPEAGQAPNYSPIACAALAAADRIVLRHPEQLRAVPPELQARTRVIGPAAVPPGPRPAAHELRPEVLMLAHLRAVKEPFTLAAAMAMLPAASNLRAVHLGAALDAASRAAAEHLTATHPRWQWLGLQPRWWARQRLRHARALVLASRHEGAPGAVVEAIVQGVPVLASDIPANRALLGESWPALFPVGDAAALARLLQRLEHDAAWTAELNRQLTERAPRFAPAAERTAWHHLITELTAPGSL
ncbi:MAG: glycosyltransferase [Planctomycetes bacterium]|nr:glycosyltransferase [Planctomycetota bacterium]